MNAAAKAAIFRPQVYCSVIKIANFHSTNVLERKRGSSECHSSSSKSNYNKNKKKRSKKFLRDHQETLRRAVEGISRAQRKKEAEDLRNNRHDSERGHNYYYVDYSFIFGSLFGVSRSFEYSAYEDEDRKWWYDPSWSSNNSKRDSWRSKYKYYDKEQENQEDQEEEDGFVSNSIQDPDKSTLGLSPFAPLKLEDIKHAYRTCALKWHPDRHDDSTRAEAEAKFKLCNMAYESLLEKLKSTNIL